MQNSDNIAFVFRECFTLLKSSNVKNVLGVSYLIITENLSSENQSKNERWVVEFTEIYEMVNVNRISKEFVYAFSCAAFKIGQLIHDRKI